MIEGELRLGQLVAVDRRAAVLAACCCARAVLHLVPEGKQRLWEALEIAEAWVRGEASEADCRGACDAARSAVRRISSPLLVEASTAANAAAGAIQLAAYVEGAAYTADAVLHLAAEARTLEHADGWPESSAPHLEHLIGLVSSLPWPCTIPSQEQLQASPPSVQVAWDAVSGTASELTMAGLVAAHERAGALGLDWNDPVQRAVAERAGDLARVGGLLQGSVAGGG